MHIDYKIPAIRSGRWLGQTAALPTGLWMTPSSLSPGRCTIEVPRWPDVSGGNMSLAEVMPCEGRRPEHRALCPVCGRLAASEAPVRRSGVLESHYICDRGHGWQTKWTPDA